MPSSGHEKTLNSPRRRASLRNVVPARCDVKSRNGSLIVQRGRTNSGRGLHWSGLASTECSGTGLTAGVQLGVHGGLTRRNLL